MSDYGSVEDISHTLCEGIYTTVTIDSVRNVICEKTISILKIAYLQLH